MTSMIKLDSPKLVNARSGCWIEVNDTFLPDPLER